MKGFKPSVKNFAFPTSADSTFGGSAVVEHRSGSMVRPHFRSKPQAYAKGGAVEGNATVQRSKPVTDFDKSAGGKGPLAPGYAKGGKACAADAKQDASMIKKAISKHVAAPAPKGHKGAPPPAKGKK